MPNDVNKSSDLSFDLGNWSVNTKVPVPVLELCKIPRQKEKILKILDFPIDTSPSTPLKPSNL